jgi:hypothetical protein
MNDRDAFLAAEAAEKEKERLACNYFSLKLAVSAALNEKGKPQSPCQCLAPLPQACYQ